MYTYNLYICIYIYICTKKIPTFTTFDSFYILFAYAIKKTNIIIDVGHWNICASKQREIFLFSKKIHNHLMSYIYLVYFLIVK